MYGICVSCSVPPVFSMGLFCGVCALRTPMPFPVWHRFWLIWIQDSVLPDFLFHAGLYHPHPGKAVEKQPRQDIRKRMLCRGCFGQHRTIASARFGGSFPPILRFEKLEILRSRWRRRSLTDAACPLRVHTGFLHFSNLVSTKNPSPNALAELCSAAKKWRRTDRSSSTFMCAR